VPKYLRTMPLVPCRPAAAAHALSDARGQGAKHPGGQAILRQQRPKILQKIKY
jgi:hypothetical protein